MNKNNTQGSQHGVYTPEPRVYELGYLIMPTVDEGSLQEERDALVALITRSKGIVISEGQPELIDLAYPMSKIINNKRQSFTQGYFGWIKFDITPNIIEAFTHEVEAVETLIRTLVIKTVRENTLSSDQPFKLARSNKSIEDEEEEDFGGAELEDEEETTEKVKEETTKTPSSISDDFTKIEGIGPKIAEVLNKKGLYTFADISSSKVNDLRDILAAEGLSQHDPSTWKKQATLAKNEKWDDLASLQEELKGGRKV